MLHLIAAIDRCHALGYRNRLLFHLPADLRRFKELTTGHTVVMGRRTFESLPKGALPHRRNIVITRGQHAWPGTEVCCSLEAALEAAAGEEVFIIGGATVYAQALPMADILHLTEIDAVAPEADVFFPPIDRQIWHEKRREAHCADDRHAVAYAFVDYVRTSDL